MTPAQLITLKAAIAAETDPVFVGYRTAGSTGSMADWYNVPSTVVVWRSTTPTGEVFNSVTWANLTPNDIPDGTLVWECRSLACQGKQFNLQTMLGGQQSVASGKVNIRNGLQDALTNVPAGAAGALIGAGWLVVRAAIQRFATSGEKIFATGTGTAALPSDLGFEGSISNGDILKALAS